MAHTAKVDETINLTYNLKKTMQNLEWNLDLSSQ